MKFALQPGSRVLVRLAAIVIVMFIGVQFIRPALTNPPVTADLNAPPLNAPPEVKNILRRSCYNCHSNETKLWWFDQIVPAYWIVANDVKTGRERLNFSELGELPRAQQQGTLYEAVNQIQLGAMPLASYKRVHPDSVVTPEELAVLKQYLHPPLPLKAAGPEENAAADEQYDKWIRSGGQPLQVRPAPNGIAFVPEYKDWKTVSSTNRFDNNTLRLVLGNPVAVRAIADGHINPWPDGTMFAKVAWAQLAGENGAVRSGSFVQVEFMIKDSKKYAATRGWGFARWRGMDLQPYGKNADFTTECVGCHNPLRNSDYVFTMPLKGQQ